MEPASRPVSWLLPLTSAAKVLVTVFIVLGAIGVIASDVYNIESNHSTLNNNGASTTSVVIG
jgi:hypothetical protein